jgi:hypothetical protein
MKLKGGSFLFVPLISFPRFSAISVNCVTSVFIWHSFEYKAPTWASTWKLLRRENGITYTHSRIPQLRTHKSSPYICTECSERRLIGHRSYRRNFPTKVLPKKMPPQANQTSQYVVRRGCIFLVQYTRCSLCRLIRLLSTWCRAATFFSASGASTLAESSDGKMNVRSACALNTP